MEIVNHLLPLIPATLLALANTFALRIISLPIFLLVGSDSLVTGVSQPWLPDLINNPYAQ